MNVLLICPEIPDTFWSFKHALRFIRKRASSPPLGLLTVASMLPPEWDLRLVDMNVRALTRKDLAWADYAFIGAMTVQRSSARRVVERCREASVRTVAGGPLFTMEHEAFPGVDHFVLNEAELTLPEFLRDLQAGSPRRIYGSPAFADITTTPAPRWDLADLNAYATMELQYSRGCPYDCEFCNVTSLFGHRPRTKTPRQVLAELNDLYELGWRGGVFFVDDNLIGHKRRLKTELLPALIEWRKGKTGMAFNTEVSINLADDPVLVRKMVEAGFNTVFVGIETPEHDGLAECDKKQNMNRDLMEDVKRLQRAGLEVQGGFILGFDSDTTSTFTRMAEFIQKSGIVTAMVGLLQAPHGTRLYERLQQAGRLIEKMSGDNTDGTTNIVPLMDPRSLHTGYRSVLERLYTPKAYYRRVQTFLKEYRPPKIKGSKRLDDLLRYGGALLASAFRLGVVGRERFQYWKLLAWTLARRPRSFPLAVRFAIYGYHFRRVVARQDP
jgi:radical SAM superfamily enzyme YgiQ (UPF0313 family)